MPILPLLPSNVILRFDYQKHQGDQHQDQGYGHSSSKESNPFREQRLGNLHEQDTQAYRQQEVTNCCQPSEQGRWPVSKVHSDAYLH